MVGGPLGLCVPSMFITKANANENLGQFFYVTAVPEPLGDETLRF